MADALRFAAGRGNTPDIGIFEWNSAHEIEETRVGRPRQEVAVTARRVDENLLGIAPIAVGDMDGIAGRRLMVGHRLPSGDHAAMTALSRNGRAAPPMVGISQDAPVAACPVKRTRRRASTHASPSAENPTLVTISLSELRCLPLREIQKFAAAHLSDEGVEWPVPVRKEDNELAVRQRSRHPVRRRRNR